MVKIDRKLTVVNKIYLETQEVIHALVKIDRKNEQCLVNSIKNLIKPKTPPPPKKDNPAKDAICHQCGEVGHWRRNCPVYLAELMKKKKLSQGASTSGIFTIELYSFPSKSWIYDTGCGTHICITTQGLRGSKKLKPGALSLYVGDGHRAAVEAIGTYHLELPSGLVIVLNNCHYAPSITRGVISVSRLFDDGFINRFDDNNDLLVSKNNLVYFKAVPRNGIFEIDMSCSNTNDSSMHSITNKRAKINLDSSLLWHCRLGHISKKRIEKLQHDGLLNSIDIESLGKCVSCLSGKMARKPYSHQVERAKDLLGLIHTDVCGPFRIVSRQGASYFVTFTDDFSRYGYVYLLKHKHEVFETFKGLRGSKKLKPGALSLYVGDGHRAAVEAIGTYHLELPSGLVIVLNNCHYAPSITRGVISVSRLFDDGFINRFDDNNVISVSKDNLVYFMAVPRDGIFEIDMSCSNTNDSSMYAITNKRAKINLDSSLLWHCRLGHISKKRIEKLQHDGLLNSIDIESLGKCVSCLSGKMARKPYSHQVERAKDLLGLIHTDVCGPFRIVSRQGASYFVTFTDDFSRYGYVYLLKYKHEVFETFKVFQKEVENQLGKIIKSLRSDRGGEYTSQEFLDHLKEHGIIAHRTPPYTPQNNRVSERRNRTLLDMVRSMMSQTTLPKSFWDYALETAARILNMVPTKKVDKTPYEIWHGQAPKLSYLRVWGCEAFVKHDTLTKPDKLDPRSFKCIFIGYPKETTGYSFYSPSEKKVFVARNAKFFESKLLDLKASGSVDTSLNHEEDDQEIDEPQSDINPIHRSTRTRRPTDQLCLYIDAEEHELGDLGKPANYKATLLDPESKKWLDAMNVEMQSMKDNDV
ncbi:retrotransposon protein, putative, ty1-copia subclass [Tanacetum coccineum]